MKRVNKDRLVNICLLLIGLVGLTFNIISNINKNKVNSEYEKPEKVNKEQFAMYIEGDAGNYVEYDSNTFPSGYILNTDNSQCIDINNNIVDGVLSYVDNSVTVTANKTVFCYLYFDRNDVVSIAVTTPPTKTLYEPGENFDSTGMVVTATYIDGTTKEITNYTITNGSNLTESQSSITISYTEDRITKTTICEINVNVSIKLESITSSSASGLPTFNIGETFSKDKIIVYANYSDGTSEVITDYTYYPTLPLTENNTVVTISYTKNGVTKNTTQEIKVGYIISIIGSGTYGVAGAIIGSSVSVGDIVYTGATQVVVMPGTTITLKSINSYFTYLNGTNYGNSVEHTVTSPMTIWLDAKNDSDSKVFAVTPISFITKLPTVIYTQNEVFSPAGMVITHTNADGTKEIVTDYTFSPAGALTTTGNQTVTISYVRDGKTYSTNLPIYVKTSSGCFAEGTLITMANGSKKTIEEITYEDKLLAWDLNTGKYVATSPSLIESHMSQNVNVIKLNFEDGTTVRIIEDHGFFDVKENKFVFLDKSNIKDYIDHEFVKTSDDGKYETVKLINYEITNEKINYYTIQTAIYNNCIAEGMFTLTSPPPGVNGWFDYFEIGKGMRYDYFKMKNDIIRYGLYTYEEFADYVTYEQFIAFNGPYLKVLVGRNIITFEKILELISTYVN